MNTTLTQPDGDDSLTVKQTNKLESPTHFPKASGARKMGLGKTGWVLLGWLVAVAPASANLVLNGSFETPLVNGAGNARCDTWGANNWNFYYGKSPEAVYIFNTAQVGLTPATDGAQAQVFFPLNDLDAVEPYISQTLSTVSGQIYDFSFDQAAAVWYSQGSTVTVSWISTNAVNPDGVDQIGQWCQAQGTAWETKHFIVKANSTSDTIKLSYQDFLPGHWGASMIDNVQVVAVPEPGPIITNIQIISGYAYIDFVSGVRFGGNDTADLFTLQSSGTVNGTYADDVSATITGLGSGSFQAVVAASGDTQFYRIKK